MDLDRGTITVEPEDAKSGRGWTIPRNQALHAEMAQHGLVIGRSQRNADRQLFVERGGEQYTTNKLRTDIQ